MRGSCGLTCWCGALRGEPEADDVVAEGDEEEGEDDDEADRAGDLSRALAERASTHRLERVEHEVAAVEDGDREEVDEADVHADQRHQQEEVAWALLGGGAGDVKDPDDRAELIDAALKGEELLDAGPHQPEHADGLLSGGAGGVGEAAADRLRARQLTRGVGLGPEPQVAALLAVDVAPHACLLGQVDLARRAPG